MICSCILEKISNKCFHMIYSYGVLCNVNGRIIEGVQESTNFDTETKLISYWSAWCLLKHGHTVCGLILDVYGGALDTVIITSVGRKKVLV